MGRVPVETWLHVIPQLIARIDTHQPLIQSLIKKLLVDVGKVHPQALVYPLTVAAASPDLQRKNAAKDLLMRLSEHSPTLVAQAQMVKELLRTKEDLSPIGRH